MDNQQTFGLVRPSIDAHTLGSSAFSQLVEDCGWQVRLAEAAICEALNDLDNKRNIDALVSWLAENNISSLGFSYRLDPDDGIAFFNKLYHVLKKERLLHSQGGLIANLLFAGLPIACEKIKQLYGEEIQVFWGDESPAESLSKAGIPKHAWPQNLTESSKYDNTLLQFGRDLIDSGENLSISSIDRSSYQDFGTKRDSLAARIDHGNQHNLPPLMRAHVGPFGQDRRQAVNEFKNWVRSLAQSGFLDILSIGSSQLTQSAFGENWDGRPNGGGVPINSEEEFYEIWEASRPMLVRTYSGTTRTRELAEVYERTINIAWHALSLWWFCEIDGRGPNGLRKNLEEHFRALRYIAQTGKPFEPNIPHHFSFRGGDDTTYVLSAVIAARAAKRVGVKKFVLQNMLNTPKSTWGVQDLAKSRAMLRLVRPLETADFKIYFQPRAGLDYFSHDLEKAKVQLAAVSALMDDIEPNNPRSPDAIHVVSYSEGSFLATPPIINESIQITRAAIEKYRKLRAAGLVEDMSKNANVDVRTKQLVDEVSILLRYIEDSIEEPYTPEGLYRIFWAGFLPTPELWEGREEFPATIAWKTRTIAGACRVVDENKRPVPIEQRAESCARLARAYPGITSNQQA